MTKLVESFVLGLGDGFWWIPQKNNYSKLETMFFYLFPHHFFMRIYPGRFAKAIVRMLPKIQQSPPKLSVEVSWCTDFCKIFSVWKNHRLTARKPKWVWNCNGDDRSKKVWLGLEKVTSSFGKRVLYPPTPLKIKQCKFSSPCFQPFKLCIVYPG